MSLLSFDVDLAPCRFPKDLLSEWAGLFFFFFLRSSMVEIRMKCGTPLQFDIYQNNTVCPKKETLSNKKK